MDARTELERLCTRYAVPLEHGQRLLPLIERALRAPPELRQRILEVVEATLNADAEELSRSKDLEQRILIAVAQVLHAWPRSRSA